MKCRRLIALTVAGMILGGSFLATVPVVNAESSVDKLEVKIDGQTLPEGGLVVDGRAYLSVRQLEDSLRAFVYWDSGNKQLFINKPNVNMVLFRDKAPFGKVELGKTTFSVLTQVDNLKATVDSIRLTITDPGGKSSVLEEGALSVTQDNFWYRSSDIKYDFKNTGKYTVNCYMRQKDGEYTLLSEMKIEAVEKAK